MPKNFDRLFTTSIHEELETLCYTLFLTSHIKRTVPLIQQIGISSLPENQEDTNLRCKNGTSSWGGIRYNAFAFTELGVAMLSSVLNSDTAININISIMRAFVAIRQNLPIINTQKELEDLRQRIIALEESDIETHNDI